MNDKCLPTRGCLMRPDGPGLVYRLDYLGEPNPGQALLDELAQVKAENTKLRKSIL